MPQKMPAIDTKSDAPVVKYIRDVGSRMRLQLSALPDSIDRVTGRVVQGETKAIQFENGVYSTNRDDIQSLIEDSYAYRAGEIERADVVEARARDNAIDSLMEQAEDDPEIFKELRSRLAKASKKSSQVVEETPA